MLAATPCSFFNCGDPRRQVRPDRFASAAGAIAVTVPSSGCLKAHLRLPALIKLIVNMLVDVETFDHFTAIIFGNLLRKGQRLIVII